MTYRLKDFGSFHIGGRKVAVTGLPPQMFAYTPASPPRPKDPNGDYWIDQVYVQFFIPEDTGDRLPIVFLHGGGLTGVTWETTPDGRPGWLNLFLGWGYHCYVVDLPERGRSGFSVLPDTWEGRPKARTAQEAWSLFRFGAPESFDARTPFDGMDFPVAALDQFSKQAVPRWTTTRDIHIRAFADVIERVGPCTVICHSQGGDTSAQVVFGKADTVANYIALEPSGFAPDLGATRLDGQRVLYVYGANIQAHEQWQHLHPLAIDSAERLSQAGADVTWMDLAEHGIAGASHMLMMDRRSADSAALVRDWLEA